MQEFFTGELLNIAQFSDKANLHDKKGNKIGRNSMFKILKQLDILTDDNKPYRAYSKYFRVKRVLKYINGEDKYILTPLITFTGQTVILEKIKEYLEQ